MYVICRNCKAEFEARYTPKVIDACGYCKPPGCCRRAKPPEPAVPSKITKKR